MRRPRIGLSTYGRGADERFSLPAQYVDAVRRAGGTPVLLPPGQHRGDRDLDDWFAVVDALLLPGGGDVAPAAWGGVPHPENYLVDPDRDADEMLMCRRAVAAKLPLLAVCRGMQVLNVAFGGTLVPHVPDAMGERVLHRSAERLPVLHRVAVAPGSRLAAALGATDVVVSSLHHQAVDRLAEGFRAVAHAPDGLVEGMERDDHPFLLAVQWHPELTAAGDPVQQRLFAALVRAA